MNSPLFRSLCLPITLHAAWKTVKLKNSAGGIDGLSVLQFEENLAGNLSDLRQELIDKTWNPEPYLRIEIAKNATEKRQLGLLSVKDKIVQQAIKTLIEPRFEKLFLNNSYGYRHGRGHAKAIRRTMNEVHQKKNVWVAQLDIANFYLHPFDQFVTSKTNSYVRYADDFLLFVETKEQIDAWVADASEFLQTRLKLKLNEPLICKLEQGIEFLGLLLSKNGIAISEKKKLKLQSDIQSIKLINGCFTKKSLETLSGIQRYYAQLLPQELLSPLDQTLKEKIASLILMDYKNIQSKKQLSATLKTISFFSQSMELNKNQLINEWLTLYSEKKKTMNADANSKDQNKQLINQKKKEYRKKEAEASELVISSFGSFIGKNNQGITVKINGKSVKKTVSHALGHITVTSRAVSISSDAIHYCMENRIPVDFFDHSGKCYASILSPVSVEQSLWQKQTGMSLETKAYLASRILLGKLKNQLHLIKYFHKYHKRGNMTLEECYNKTTAHLDELIEKMKGFRQGNNNYSEQLIAYEASGATSYWEYIRHLLMDDGVEFENRERYGATDLFNCMLNYGYALLYSRVWQAVLAAKLNPSVGVLHAYQQGKPTFVYDVIEIFRAQAVDRVIIGLVQKSEPLKMDKNLLDEETRKLIVQNVLERMNRYEKYRKAEIKFIDILRQQLKEIASYIVGEKKTFKPYIAKW